MELGSSLPGNTTLPGWLVSTGVTGVTGVIVLPPGSITVVAPGTTAIPGASASFCISFARSSFRSAARPLSWLIGDMTFLLAIDTLSSSASSELSEGAGSSA